MWAGSYVLKKELQAGALAQMLIVILIMPLIYLKNCDICGLNKNKIHE
jgi:hypothetical protein